ncbi:MAG: hypothetical protein ABI697_10575 [Devosia sp.]
MKIAMLFVRSKPRRKAPKTEAAEMVTTWTTRQWADLPAYHPRHD